MAVMDYIEGVLVNEGGGTYTDDPGDSGGPTRWGITEVTARAAGYNGDMRELPRQVAVNIYLQRYWVVPGLALVDQVFPALAARLLDFGVLAGSSVAAVQLQRCLNVLNRCGKDYPDIKADGRVGRITIGALTSFISRRGEEGRIVLLGMVVSLQSAYLTELAELRPKDELYLFGWQRNRAIGALLMGDGQ